MKQKILLLALVAVVLAHSIAGCGLCFASEEVPELLEPLEVRLKAKKVSRGDIFDIVAYQGSVKEDSVAYAFSQASYVENILVYPGQEVKQGDLIAKVNQDEYSKELQDMQATVTYLNRMNEIETALADISVSQSASRLNQAKLSYNQLEDKTPMDRVGIEEMERNHNMLVEQSAYDLENRKLEIQRAKASYDAAYGKSGSRDLYAQEDGRVIFAKDYSVGNPTGYTNANEIVAVTTKEGKHYISSEMPIVTAREADELYALIGNKRYELTYEPYEEDEMKRASTTGTTLKTRFSCEEDIAGLVGEAVTVYAVSNLKKNVMYVSPDSVFTENHVSFVYLLKDGSKEKREVEIGTRTKNAVEIISGLEEGVDVYCQANDVPSSKHRLVTVEKQTLDITKRYDQAKVSSMMTAQVVNRASNAVLEELLVKNGDTVSKGDVIAYLRVSQGESATAENKVSLENLKRAYDYEVLQYTHELSKKQKQLRDMEKEETTTTMTYKEISAEAETLQLKIQKETATYEYETGKLKRELSENAKTKGRIAITAPIQGTVRELASLTEGHFVDEDCLVCKIIPDTQTCVKVFTDGVNVPIGSRVSVTGANQQEFEGTVVSCYHDVASVVYEDGMYLNETSAQTNDATYVVLAEEDSYEKLSNVGVKINVWNVEDAIVINSDCVYLQGDKKTGKRYVWVNENGDLYKRYVTVGYLDGDIAWIVQGLSEGEQVVLEHAGGEE